MIKDLSRVLIIPAYTSFDKSKIIYIGKAKDLKSGIYFTPAIKDRKTEQIKKQAIKVETFQLYETEALIYSNNFSSLRI